MIALDRMILLAQNAQPADTTGALGWWVVGLISIAAFFVALEVFLPSHGLLSLVAGLCAMAGVVTAFRISPMTGAITLGIVAVCTPASFWLAIKVFPSTPVGRRIILTDGSTEDDMQQRMHERSIEDEALSSLVGMEAIALTGLRPGGTIRIQGRDIEAFSETGLIDAGQQVIIASVNGRQIRVQPIAPTDSNTDT